MTKARRKDPTKDEKLAACLLMIADLQGKGIDFKHAQQMHPEQIISLFQFDHARRVTDGGSNHPTNLTPRFRRAHMDKTAKFDVPQIRKGDRIREGEAEHHEKMRRKLLAPTPSEDDNPPANKKSRWGKGRKIQNHQDPWGKKRRNDKAST
jgi:hypothetical protein